MASFQNPKTDWALKNSDGTYQAFNIDPDYTRITGNIEYLKELIAIIRPPGQFTVPDEQTILDTPTAEVFNKIETVLTELHQAYRYAKIPWERKTWAPNQPAPTYDDLNRWETLIKNLYDQASVQVEVLPVLSFTLGGVQFNG